MFFPKADFRRATPESQGVKSSAIQAAIDEIIASGKDIHSMLVLKNGALISETYFAPYTHRTKHSLYSCSKTFTSMLIGIAQHKELLSLSDTVASFFPEKLPDSPSENLLRMEIRHLLCMATGNDADTFPPMTRSQADWVRTFLSCPVEHEPGTHFCYNTGATYILSAILTKVTGKTALQLASEWIFDKIGICNAQWEASPDGISLGGTGLHLTPRQMARFGLLLLNEGNWNGEQIIPREYILEAREKKITTVDHIHHPDWCSGYCYQMWRCSFDAYRADGMGGQFIVVLPNENAVVVFTSALSNDIVFPMDITSKHLCGALSGTEPLLEDASASAALVSLSKCCQKPEPQPLPTAALSAIPWGKIIVPKEKLLGFISSLTLYDGRVLIGTDRGTLQFPYFWNAPALGENALRLPRLRTPARVSFMGKCEEDSLLLQIGILGEPSTFRLRMAFTAAGVHISTKATMGKDAETEATIGA